MGGMIDIDRIERIIFSDGEVAEDVVDIGSEEHIYSGGPWNVEFFVKWIDGQGRFRMRAEDAKDLRFVLKPKCTGTCSNG